MIVIDEQIDKIESGVWSCLARNCKGCPYHYNGCEDLLADFREYLLSLKRAKTQLRELLSALYQKTIKENGCFVVFRKDVIGLAKDYGIREEELNVFRTV